MTRKVHNARLQLAEKVLDEISAAGAGTVVGRFQRAVASGQKKTNKKPSDITRQENRIKSKIGDPHRMEKLGGPGKTGKNVKKALGQVGDDFQYNYDSEFNKFDAARRTVGVDDKEPVNMPRVKKKP